MNNVLIAAWRLPCSLNNISASAVPSCLLNCQRSIWRSTRTSCAGPSATPRASRHTGRIPFQRQFSQCCSRRANPLSVSLRLKPRARKQGNVPRPTIVEEGIRWEQDDLQKSEIKSIFGTIPISKATGNRLLRVLHGRRILGVLDFELPPDLIEQIDDPAAIEKALAWLRQSLPVDEDAAVIRRIQEEDERESQQLVERSQKLGFYKPQSGNFGTKLGEEGDDVYGTSVLEQVRKVNEARAKAEEARNERLRLAAEKEAMEKATGPKHLQARDESDSALVRAPRVDPKARPGLAWIERHHIRATQQLKEDEIRSKTRRVVPAFLFTALTIGGCIWYAESYQEPHKWQRLFKDYSPATATIIGLVAANVVVYLLWKFPPAWRMLNRYFICAPAVPHAASVVGTAFSQQEFRHLAINMLILSLFCSRLHDDVGRGTFLAIYVASGAAGSFTSLAAGILSNNVALTSLGASGAISGLVAAWCLIHSSENLTLQFLPIEWQRFLSVQVSTFFAGTIAVEVLSLLLSLTRKTRKVDHLAHLGGYATGAAWGYIWRERERTRPLANVTRIS